MKKPLLSLLTMFLVACGTPTEKKAPPTTTTKEAPPTTVTTTERSWQETYREIPSSAAILIRLPAPTQMISAWKALGAQLLTQEQLSEMEMGSSILGLFGVDATKGVTFLVDSALSLSSSPEKTMPAMRITIPLTNEETFMRGARDLAARELPTYTTAEASAGGYAMLYLYNEASPPTESQSSLRAALLVKDKVASVFVLEGSLLSRSALQEQLVQYLARPVVSSIVDDPLFQSLTAKADPMGSFFFFLSGANINKNPGGGASQSARSQRLLESFPGVAGSLTFSAEGLRGGYAAKLVPPTLSGYRSITPSKEAPPYGSIFPSNTSVLLRSSLDLLGFKDALVELAPETAPMFAQMTVSVNEATGLGLESDLLLGLTGHFAAGLDVSMIRTATLSKPFPPLGFLVLQLTSEVAGDKLLTVLVPAVEKMFPEWKIQSEDIDGARLYSIQKEEGGSTFAAQRCQDLLLIGFGKDAIREMCSRVKSPGASLADKWSGVMAREVFNAKTGGGLYADLVPMIEAVMTNLPAQKADLEPVAKLFSMLGPFVYRSDYDAASQLYVGAFDMSLRR